MLKVIQGQRKWNPRAFDEFPFDSDFGFFSQTSMMFVYASFPQRIQHNSISIDLALKCTGLRTYNALYRIKTDHLNRPMVVAFVGIHFFV